MFKCQFLRKLSQIKSNGKKQELLILVDSWLEDNLDMLDNVNEES